MSKNNKWLIGGIVGVLLLCVCLFAVSLVTGGLAIFAINNRVVEVLPPTIAETMTVRLEEKPLPVEKTPVPTLPLEATRTPVSIDESEPADAGAQETLNTLLNETVPINDPRDLARRLAGIHGIPETLDTVPPLLETGEQKMFWVTNVQTNERFQVNASLRYITDHLYFWIENGVIYNDNDLKRLAETFENEIYPTNRAFFGSEWTPGVDNDPHLYVLYARGLGSSIAGYFSSSDSLHPLAYEYSNGHEMFLISADNLRLDEDIVYGTMAHEFQHMIHWYRDRNEESWLNEGFSVLAEFLNGYEIGGFDYLYVSQPDIQLTYWPSPPASRPHYGASFLFVSYFLDRFGDEATKAVVAHQDNGMDSIDAVLAELDIIDALTGVLIQADDVFADWVVTSFLNDPNVSDGRYAYQRYSYAPQPSETETVDDCAPEWQSRTVQQYGVDYIAIRCLENVTLEFEGQTEVGVLPQDAYSGDYAFWSNKGDASNMTLTREFDFTEVSGPLTLTFNTWFDIETDYDYLYLVASENGEDWEILQTPSGTNEDPTGNSYGWGYNGQTSGWIEENVDLSDFAGKKIQLRFEYVTDAAVNGEGFLLDDVRIPVIDYSEDFEQGTGGWQAEGFVRIQNRLPQIFRVSLIANGETTQVENFSLNSGESLRVPLEFDGDLEDAVLVVSGVTRFTTQAAQYRFSFQK
jgi:immune inhibitor A